MACRWPAGGRGLAAMLLCLACLATGLPARASAPSASAGKAISGMCAACHGSKGRAVATRYPNLAGQHYQYLLQQLKAFKDGQRSNPIMHSNTQDLSLKQMKDLAAYFASLGTGTCAAGKGASHG